MRGTKMRRLMRGSKMNKEHHLVAGCFLKRDDGQVERGGAVKGAVK